MRTCTLLLPLLLSMHVSAQEDIRQFRPSAAPPAEIQHLPQPAGGAAQAATPGKVTVVESDQIKALMADYASRKQSLAGYRVQIFLGDRSTAENTRRTFMQQHPDIPAYLSYLAPNFRVRVGDLRDRVEADYLRRRLGTEFPGLYVVPDQIEPPRLAGKDN